MADDQSGSAVEVCLEWPWAPEARAALLAGEVDQARRLESLNVRLVRVSEVLGILFAVELIGGVIEVRMRPGCRVSVADLMETALDAVEHA